MKRIRVDDEVIVISGREKGRRGYVVRFEGEDRVVVAGVNQVKKHQRATREGEQSRILDIEAPLHISNVAIVNPNTDERDKVTFVEEDGVKQRVFKSSKDKVDV